MAAKRRNWLTGWVLFGSCEIHLFWNVITTINRDARMHSYKIIKQPKLRIVLVTILLSIATTSAYSQTACISKNDILSDDYEFQVGNQADPCNSTVGFQLSYLKYSIYGPPLNSDADLTIVSIPSYYRRSRQALFALDELEDSEMAFVMVELSVSDLDGSEIIENMIKRDIYDLFRISLLMDIVDLPLGELLLRHYSDRLSEQRLDSKSLNAYCFVRADFPNSQVSEILNSQFYKNCKEFE